MGATAGVFGNAKGGVWGAIVEPFVGGLIITFIPVFFVLGNWAPTDTNELGKLILQMEKMEIQTLSH
ncbi:hypothetical protein NW062_04160 [Mycoplasmopsis cynos]|nr:hypothetical protein NW062_04160 [Mycoplasmopsis cynos]